MHHRNYNTAICTRTSYLFSFKKEQEVKYMIKPDENASILKVSISFDGFGSGTSDNISSALARPYRKVMNTGKPCGELTHIFALDEKNKSYVLGSLEYTTGKRVIFYLGLMDRKLNWYTHKGQMHDEESKIGELMDHFTLEKNLKKSHGKQK